MDSTHIFIICRDITAARLNIAIHNLKSAGFRVFYFENKI